MLVPVYFIVRRGKNSLDDHLLSSRTHDKLAVFVSRAGYLIRRLGIGCLGGLSEQRKEVVYSSLSELLRPRDETVHVSVRPKKVVRPVAHRPLKGSIFS